MMKTLKKLSLIMTLYDCSFGSSEVETYIRLVMKEKNV